MPDDNVTQSPPTTTTSSADLPPAEGDLGIPDPPEAPVEASGQSTETKPDEKPLSVLFSPEDLNKFTEEATANGGTLTEDTIKSIEKKGLPRPLVDTYLAGLKAMVEVKKLTVLAEAGGRDQWAQVQKWAASTMTKEERAAFNAAQQGRDISALAKATKEVVAKYKASNGSPPKRTVTGAPAPNGPAPFESITELARAIGDPRYQTDAAYRRGVEARIKASGSNP